MNHLWMRTMLFNTPLLVHGDYLSQVLNLFTERLSITTVNTFTNDQQPFDSSVQPHSLTSYMQMQAGEMVAMDSMEQVEPSASDSIAIIPILGSLVQRSAGGFESMSTATRSYEDIRRDVLQASQMDGIGGAILKVDSPGGVHHGCSETSEAIRKLSAEMDFPIWTSVEGSSMSAAYNLSTAGQRINAQPSSYAGSIGAFIAHTSVAEAMDRAGIDVTVVKSGAKKAAGIPSAKLSAETIADLQVKVNAARDQFIETVVSHREGVTTRSILSLEAGWFTAQDAVQEGLIDSVGASEDFYQEFIEHVNSSSTAVSLAEPGNTTETHMNMKTKTGEQVPEIKAEDVTNAKAEGVEQGRTEAADRYSKIYAHKNHAVDSAFTAELAADTSLSVERVNSMLDRMQSPQAAEPAPKKPDVPSDEQLTTRFGAAALDGISAQDKSILHKVYGNSPGPDVSLDNFDPLNPNEPQNQTVQKPETRSAFEIQQASLNEKFGTVEMPNAKVAGE